MTIWVFPMCDALCLSFFSEGNYRFIIFSLIFWQMYSNFFFPFRDILDAARHLEYVLNRDDKMKLSRRNFTRFEEYVK